MHVTTAQLPDPEHSDDRIFLTDNAVVVLDGASAFLPVRVSAAAYADSLGRTIAALLTDDPTAGLQHILAGAIERTATELDLQVGESPSSTVSILRARVDTAELLVLGDTPIVVRAEPPTVICDNRMAEIDAPEADTYRARLAAGYGYDQEHHRLLGALQRRQRAARNRVDGYWIAEADPKAAEHALTTSIPFDMSSSWAVIATDGAAAHVSSRDWSHVARRTGQQLAELLASWFQWEELTDPDGRQLPRAKRHDDMTLAVIRR